MTHTSAPHVNHQVIGPPDGRPVVLSGSLGSNLHMWDGQVAALRRTHRVVRYDHRGHGNSPVPSGPYTLADLGGDVVALLDRLAIKRANFVGLSLGGMVGLWLAAHDPDRVDRLVLMCTSAHMPPAKGWRDRADAVRQQGMNAVTEAVVGRWLTPAFAVKHPDLVDQLRRMVVTTPSEGYAACCDALAAMDLRADLPRVRAPTLIVVGADDRATPIDHGQQIAQRVPHARLVVVRDAAHLANVQQPEAVNDLMLAHLQKETT